MTNYSALAISAQFTSIKRLQDYLRQGRNAMRFSLDVDDDVMEEFFEMMMRR